MSTYTIESYPQTFSEQAPPEVAGQTLTRWRAVGADGRAALSGWETRESIEQAVAAREADEKPTRVWFADGTTRVLPTATAATVVGLDADGYVVCQSDGMTYALTACCNATAKGSEYGIVCRSCYEDVHPRLGGEATVAVPVAHAPARITAADVREGDVIQQARRFWPPQTVTAVTERYGRLTFDLSGGSRVTGVAPAAPFLRY